MKVQTRIAPANLEQWLDRHALSSAEIDCATAVMLKILDNKCKMNPEEKAVMNALYEGIKHLSGLLLDIEMHNLIAHCKQQDHLDEKQRFYIYEKRVLAETMISRPVMKEFKKRIREAGLFDLMVPLLIIEGCDK
ncbi:MAG: hypothetical protein MI864_22175 [Pseudomonadales bacterium]|nr:hypothetical protein [Pseudomonadales bacterium]